MQCNILSEIMSEQLSQDVLEYLQARYDQGNFGQQEVIDSAVVIGLSDHGVDRDGAPNTLGRGQGRSQRRFAKAAFLGSDFQAWRREQQKLEVTFVDGVQPPLPIWYEDVSSTEGNVEARVIVDENVQEAASRVLPTDDSQPELAYDPANASLEVADMSSLTRLFPDVPDKLSPSLKDPEKKKYESASEERWRSVIGALSSEPGVQPETVNPEAIQQLLLDYSTSELHFSRPRHLPDNYRLIYAAMLLKYFEGASPLSIRKAVSKINGAYTTKIPNLRAVFVSFAAGQLDPNNHKSPVTHKRKRLPSGRGGNRYLRVVEGMHRQRIEFEKRARHVRQESGHDAYIRRGHVVDRLAIVLGGNRGAFRRIFSLPKECIVEERDLSDARQRLWESLVRNVQKRSELGSEVMITNEELAWMAPLCGMRLVADPVTKRLTPELAEPRTMDEIKALAVYLETTHVDGDRPKRSAADIERIIQAACNKLASFIIDKH